MFSGLELDLVARVRAPKAISLYSGVGGLDYGFEAAGFETAVALDFDPNACRALRANRPWPVIETDIARAASREILDAGSLRASEPDILIGGPPCQPFSKSGYWVNGDARRLDDPRAGTLGQYLRVLRDTLPKAFLLENVLGLAYSGKSEGLDLIMRGIATVNEQTGASYSISVRALNAADYGVPQLRERVFVIGSRDGVSFRFPKPTHAPADKLEAQGTHERYRTAWDALADLPQSPNDPALVMTGKWADLLPSIPEGQNYLWHTPRGGGKPLFGWRTRYWSFLLKLAKSQPSWTIQAQPGPATGPFHWRNRKLSVIELARLQTFPERLIFDCSRQDAQRLIGNAVPSALAERLAREIKAQLLGADDVTRSLYLVQPARGTPPEPEPVQKLLRKYYGLIGNHSDHPGTGKGQRASRRLKDAA